MTATRHFYRVPAAAIDELKTAHAAGEWRALIKAWNTYRITNTRLCNCLSGIETVRDELPLLWTRPPLKNKNAAD